MGYLFIPSGGGGGLGATGPAGADGSTIEAGAGAPPTAGSAEGFDRFWLNTTTNEFYQLAANSAPLSTNWTLIADFTGSAGVAGATGGSGDKWTVVSLNNASPTDKVSADVFDEYRLDTDTGNIWYLAATNTTGWSNVGTLVGIQGNQGIQGIQGDKGDDGDDGTVWTADTSVPSNASGDDGDFHYKSDTKQIYRKDTGSWVLLTTIQDGNDGAQGDAGTITIGTVTEGVAGVTNVGTSVAAILNFSVPKGDSGQDGEDGSTWTADTSDKLDNEGSVGDFHLNNNTFDVFQKKEVAHVSSFTISGQDDGQAGVNFDANGLMLFDSFDSNEKATYRRDNTPDPDYIIVYDNSNSRWELRLDDDDGSGYQSPVFAYNNLSDSEDTYYPNKDTWTINTTNWTSSSASVGTFTPSTLGSQKNHWYRIANLKAAGEGVPTGGATGQVLRKKSGTDYDTEWVTSSASGGSGLTNWAEDSNGHLIPNADATYNIGSLARQINDLYVSANSLYIGGNKLSVDASDNITYLVDGESNPLPLTKSGGTKLIAGDIDVTAGTVTTGAAGTDASVNITSSASAHTLNFTIPKGDKGDKGDDGYTGTLNITNSVSDSSSLPTGLGAGDAGNAYITENDGNLHVWDGSAFTDVGQIKGDKGDAPSFISEARAPQASDGVDGDMFINSVNGDLYGPKASGAWPVTPMVNLKGPTGSTGATGNDGAQGLQGNTGTISVGTTSSLAADQQPSVTNSGTSTAAVFDFAIPKGEKGDKGDEGNTNAIVITGQVADSSALPSDLGAGDVGVGYITTDNNHLNVWTGSAWLSVGEVKGPQGDTGKGFTGGSYDSATGIVTFASADGLGFQTSDLRGANGTNGSGWTSDSGAPNNASGADGDFYFDTATNKFYKKESGNWNEITNLPNANGSPSVNETIILELTDEFGKPQDGTVSHVKSLRLPYNFRLTGVSAFCNEAFTEHALEITIKKGATSMLTTNLFLETGKVISQDSTTQAVIDTSERDVAATGLITIGTIWTDSGNGFGVKVILEGERI